MSRRCTAVMGRPIVAFILMSSLAKPDPKREARGSGDKPIPTFVPQYVILYVRLHNA